ncbi:MAG: sugar kinase, partial [Gemmatimonadota bacterium]
MKREDPLRAARAFAPGNISGVFEIIYHEDPRQMHSLGMGFTVSDGATVTVEPMLSAPDCAIRFNGQPIDFPTVAAVVERLAPAPVAVDIHTALPLSCGFGLSGASALATAYALDRLYGLGLPRQDLAMVAHVAEVRNLTGLGDVCAQYHGGCLVKLRPGYPLAAERLGVRPMPIHYRYFSPISTRAVLSDAARRERINAAGARALEDLARFTRANAVDFEDIIIVCRRFAEDSGLLEDESVRQAIARVEA